MIIKSKISFQVQCSLLKWRIGLTELKTLLLPELMFFRLRPILAMLDFVLIIKKNSEKGDRYLYVFVKSIWNVISILYFAVTAGGFLLFLADKQGIFRKCIRFAYYLFWSCHVEWIKYKRDIMQCGM